MTPGSAFVHAGARITAIKVRPALVPLTPPHRTASGVVTESPLALIDLQTDAGPVGRSMIFTYTAKVLRPVVELIEQLGAMIVGQELAPTTIERALSSRFRLLGTTGLVGMAIAGIDMAAWDGLARISGVSLLRLLGGSPKPVPAYGAIGFDGPAESARVAEDWARRGLKAVKAKIGYDTAEKDLEVVRAIQQAGVHVMVDYNQSLSPAQAKARLRRIDDAGLIWIEEPTLSHDFSGHASIAAEIETPIQCGENWWGPLDVRTAIASAASDYIMLDVMKIGGVTGWMRSAALCEASGIPVSNHLWPEVSAQLLAVTPTAHWLEYSDWWNPVLVSPLELKDGAAVPSELPGSGLEWNEEYLKTVAL